MKKLVVAAALLSVSGFAMAEGMASSVGESLNPWPGQSAYVELTGGTNLYYIAIGNLSSKTEDGGVTGWGWSGAAGYNFGSHFALEVGLMQNYDNFETEDSDDDDSDDTYVAGHTNVPYFVTRFTVPMGHAAFIAKVGLMYVSATGSGTVTQNGQKHNAGVDTLGYTLPMIGLGFGYSFTPHIQLIAQYQGAVYGIVGAGLLSVGLDYRF